MATFGELQVMYGFGGTAPMMPTMVHDKPKSRSEDIPSAMSTDKGNGEAD